MHSVPAILSCVMVAITIGSSRGDAPRAIQTDDGPSSCRIVADWSNTPELTTYHFVISGQERVSDAIKKVKALHLLPESTFVCVRRGSSVADSHTLIVNWRSVRMGKNHDTDYRLQANDEIYVQTRPITIAGGYARLPSVFELSYKALSSRIDALFPIGGAAPR